MISYSSPRVCIAGLLFSLGLAPLHAQAANEIQWRQSLAKALEEAAEEGRPILADFGASW